MLSYKDLVQCYQPKPGMDRLLIGFEYEVQLVDRATAAPVRYEGPRGLFAILQRSAEYYGVGLPAAQGGGPINKLPLPEGRQLSLEPGGQFEFSSGPVAEFRRLLEQLDEFVSLVRLICAEFDLVAFFGGVNPLHTVDDIGLIIPTERYQIMNDYFPTVGAHGRRMMRQSCSVQVTFDFQGEDLGRELLRTALYIAPYAMAMLANSPFVDGQRAKTRCFRTEIWADTDPYRCGPVPGFQATDFSFEDYARFVTKAPMFFVERGDRLIPAEGLTFAGFMERGFAGAMPTISDFELHNSTIFTDARLKRTVELRSIDGQDPAMVPAALALVAGLLMCSCARKGVLTLLAPLASNNYGELALNLARDGLTGEVAGKPVREIAEELIQLAREGLTSCFSDGEHAGRCLRPLQRLVTAGQTPADVVLDRFGDAQSWLRAGHTFDAGEFG